MISRCSACDAEGVSHTAPGPSDLCGSCFARGTLRPVEPATASAAARSWDELLSRPDQDLLDYCRWLAEGGE